MRAALQNSSIEFVRPPGPAAAVFRFPQGGGQMAGRPKKAGRRHPGGRLDRNIPPPDEVLDQRARLVGKDNARDQRAGYPLGILSLRGILLATDYAAGMRYGGLY